MPQRKARSALLSLLVLAASGCASSLDMATAYDASRPATTIPYASVRAARQFPDYEPIGRSILTSADPAAALAPPKAAKPKKGRK